MKKIYATLILAIAAICTASAGNVRPGSMLRSTDFKDVNVTLSEAGSTEAVAVEALKTPFAAPASRAGEKATYDDLAGIYIFQAFEAYKNSAGQMTQGWTLRTLTTIKPTGNNKVDITGIYNFSDLTVEGIWDEAKQTITIPAGQQCKATINEKVETVTVYNFLTATKTASDIVLQVAPNGRRLIYQADNNGKNYTSVLCITPVSMALGNTYCNIYTVDMQEFNSTASYTVLGEKPDMSDAQKMSDFVYAQILPNGNVQIDGFFQEWAHPITLTVDKTKKTATASKQLVAEDQIDNKPYKFYLMGVDNRGNFTSDLTFNITVDQETEDGATFPVSTLKADQAVIIDDTKEYGFELINFSFELIDFDVLNTTGSVEGIVNDTDADAPVEYYNLQGVRVANPEAGQLVIKRQGSTVTKMIMR